MMYALGFLVSTATGYLLVRRLAGKRITGLLRVFLGAALGFGVSGLTAFYTLLCLGQYIPLVSICLSLALLAVLLFLNRNERYLVPSFQKVDGTFFDLALLALIAVFISLEAAHYPLGGWDAWSCWNLKAKFIYLGGENWKEMFDPALWRSNTKYPLLLPCINAWSWSWSGGAQSWVPMLNSIIFTVLSAGVLLFGLKSLVPNRTLPLALTAVVFLLPFNITLSASQYSDILVGLYLLCAFICLFKDQWVLAGLFLGLLSFTKTEGTLAAGILTLLIVIDRNKRYLAPSFQKVDGTFLAGLAVTGAATLIFMLFLAPSNEAFINGLFSAKKPSTLVRLQTVATYPLFELISLKWNGLWLLVLAGLATVWKNASGKKLRIFGVFFAVYLGVLLAYYQINTFFEIGWWLQNTLNRILFALMPSFMLWLGLAI